MTYVDIHCHLDWKSFDEDRNNLIKELEKNKILAFTNTMNLENYKYTKKLYEKTDTVKVCPGLYPQEAEKISEEDFNKYLKFLEKNSNEYLAIGEIGLDRFETKDEKLLEIQIKRLKKIIELGIKLNKPLILHTRKMEKKVLEIIEEYVIKTGFKKFNLHCFTGKKKLIDKIKELGIYCSIPLIVQNTQSFQILVEKLPIRQILVETDSPFLHPQKTRNSPLSVPLIYKEIARIKGYDLKEIENIIFRNYMKFIN